MAGSRSMGVSCHLLSGDRREVVARVAASIGCTDFAGDLSPADKPLRVRALRARAGADRHGRGRCQRRAGAGRRRCRYRFRARRDLARSPADVIILGKTFSRFPACLDSARGHSTSCGRIWVWAFAYNAAASSSPLMSVATGRRGRAMVLPAYAVWCNNSKNAPQPGGVRVDQAERGGTDDEERSRSICLDLSGCGTVQWVPAPRGQRIDLYRSCNCAFEQCPKFSPIFRNAAPSNAPRNTINASKHAQALQVPHAT